MYQCGNKRQILLAETCIRTVRGDRTCNQGKLSRQEEETRIADRDMNQGRKIILKMLAEICFRAGRKRRHDMQKEICIRAGRQDRAYSQRYVLWQEEDTGQADRDVYCHATLAMSQQRKEETGHAASDMHQGKERRDMTCIQSSASGHERGDRTCSQRYVLGQEEKTGCSARYIYQDMSEGTGHAYTVKNAEA